MPNNKPFDFAEPLEGEAPKAFNFGEGVTNTFPEKAHLASDRAQLMYPLDKQTQELLKAFLQDHSSELIRIGAGGSSTATFTIAPEGIAADYNTDGIADQTEINQAIDDLPAAGGRIILREGTYTLSGKIIIDKSNVILEGQGMGSKIILANTTNTDIIEIGDGVSTYTFISVKNLYIEGNKANQTSNGMGIQILANTKKVIVENCRIENTESDGIEIAGNDCRIINNMIETPGARGIEINSPAARNVIQGNLINSPANYGIMNNSGSTYCEIIGNTVITPSGQAAAISSDASYTRIFSNSIEITIDDTDGIILGNSSEVTVGGNVIIFNVGTPATQSFGIIPAVANATIVGNVISGADALQTLTAIGGATFSLTTIAGNVIENAQNGIGSAGFAFSRCIITGNHIRGRGTLGLEGIIAGTTGSAASNNNIITNNTIRNFGKEAIRLRQANYNMISNNAISSVGRLTNDTYPAISLEQRQAGQESTYNTIVGNTVTSEETNKHKYGFREIEAGDGPNIVANNIFLNAVTAAISTQHIGTDVSHNITA